MRFGAALLALGLWLASTPTQADEPSEHIVEVRGDVEQMLMDGRTDELDAIGDDYRASRARVRGGSWALARFYDWVTPFVGSGCGCEPDISTVAFDDKRKAIEAWLERRPHSLTARIALAELWELRAWQLRGVRSAKDTSEAEWRGFNEAMARAEEALAPVDATADPTVYFLEMELAVVSNDPRERLQSLYARATATFPTFPAYAPQHYNFTLERWYGRPGEAAAFAASLLANPGGDQGKIDYVWVAAKAATLSAGPDDVIKWSGIDYNALIKAAAAQQGAVGLTNRDWNVLLFYSIAVRDKKGANFELEHIAGNWDRGIFRTQALIDWVEGWSKSWL
jgi:Domain of unknown function (DUF4034)